MTHGDASKTYRVGENVDESSCKLIEVTEQALNDSIKSIGPGANLTEVVRTSYYSALLTLQMTTNNKGCLFHSLG